MDPEERENRLDFELLMRASTVSGSSSTTSSIDIWPLQLNTTFIDHYIFGDLIGRGSYAEVRECIDTRSLERCAVKIINMTYLKRHAPNTVPYQWQEIKLLKRLCHPNIIALKECLIKGPKIYLVLEYCTFVLHDLLAEQPENRLTDLLTVRNLFHQLILGLQYMHSLGIVHRDIKPQNLLITTSGELKIIDFGVSQVLSMWDKSDICFNHEGSPLFQAPEVVAGQHEYAGFKIDVWSAGVTLYLTLYGEYPFVDEALLGLYDRILSEDFSIPTNISLSNQTVITDLLAIMLDKDHEKRATTSQILDHCWLKYDPFNHSHSGDHSEFLDITSYQGIDADRKQPANSTVRDIYKSMTVLPYLHNYHYPNLRIMKPKSRAASNSSSLSSTISSSNRSEAEPIPVESSGITFPKLSAQADISQAATSNDRSPRTSEASSIGSARLSASLDPHEFINAADRPIEWGTEEQYNLMKVPLVRANRVRQPIRRRWSR